MLFGNGCNSYWILFIILILVLTGDNGCHNGCGCNQNNCGCAQSNCGCGCN